MIIRRYGFIMGVVGRKLPIYDLQPCISLGLQKREIQKIFNSIHSNYIPLDNEPIYLRN